MKVEFYTLENGEDSLAGSITFVDDKLTADPADSQLLNNIMKSPVGGDMLGRRVSPRDDPEEWMKMLYKHYRSAYLRATEPQG